MQTVTPCLWFDTEGEDAAKLLRLDLPELEDRRTSRTTARPGRGPRERS